MINVIVFILVLVVLAVFGIFYRRENKRRKRSEAIFNKRLANIDRIKSGFKGDLQRLGELGVLSEQGEEAMFRLASHYFLFQPATAKSVEEFEEVLKSLLMVVREKFQQPENNSAVFIRLHMDQFVSALPRRAADYTPEFYSNELPVLVEQLAQAQGLLEQENDTLFP
ncbi:hypothetical protein P7F88_09895 [Vibrio hannami]|uniref:hypothetical protein n=1 Tax=Vibrio hannami TaxID=2717094 RepID=UPI00240EC38F|nr:hypothetical protein [Vibrio hannami]MDG3086404.1 hypothetical protein [Vibrio hannami]